ncbi:MAG: hypothetical protein L3J53_08170 [Proteobacteria bacterium]|nr:hypothetical protein [Pseudomonadota bacterium]
MKNLYITGLLLLIVSSIAMAAPVGSRFSYQGELQDAGSPANGMYDFRMEIWSTETGGTTVASQVNLEDVSVVNGLFTVELDFGDAPFNGEDNFLKIQVREGASTGGYTALSPRQRINAVPYAIQSEFVENGSSPWEDFAGGIRYLDDVTIGTLTSSSPSKVTIAADSGTEPFRARVGGATRFLVTANGGAVIGANGTSPSQGLYVEGDANQALSSSGFVKAGMVVRCSSNDSMIDRSFNNVNDQAITIQNGSGTGRCNIKFPFSLQDRYYVVTAFNVGVPIRVVNCQQQASDSPDLLCFSTGVNGVPLNTNLSILVY